MRFYKMRIDPPLPVRRWKRQILMPHLYFRGDREYEAKQSAAQYVTLKAWSFPRGLMLVRLSVEGTPRTTSPMLVDIDAARRMLDPVKWNSTDPMNRWLAQREERGAGA